MQGPEAGGPEAGVAETRSLEATYRPTESAATGVFQAMAIDRVGTDYGMGIAKHQRDEIVEAAETAAEKGCWAQAAAAWAEFRALFSEEQSGYVEGVLALRNAGRVDEALAVAEAGIKLFPDDARPLIELAWCRWTSGDAVTTVDLSRTLLQRFADLPDGYMLGICALNTLGRFEEAEALCETAKRLFPDDEAIQTEHALQPSRRGEWTETARRLDLLHRRFPLYSSAFTLCVAALREAGLFDAADALADESISRFPDDLEPLLEWTRISSARGEREQLLARCAVLRQRFPDDVRGATMAVEAYRSLGEIGRADEIAKTELVRFPNEEALWREAAQVAIDGSDWAAAEIRLRETRLRFPDSPSGWTQGVAALRELKDFVAAEALAEEAISRFPDLLDLLQERVWTAWARGDRALAIARCADLRMRFPGEAVGYTMGVGLLRELGQLEQAEVLAAEGVEHMPDTAPIWVDHVALALDRGDSDEALARASKMRGRLPEAAESYAIGAFVLRAAGMLAEADAMAADGIVRFPDDANLQAERAWIAGARNDWQSMLNYAEAMRSRFQDQATGWILSLAALRMLNRATEGDALASAAVSAFPTDSSILVESALLAHHLEDWPQAVSRWERVRRVCPDVIEGYSLGVDALRAAGRTAEAEAIALAGLARFPAAFELHVAHAGLAAERQDAQEAARRWAATRESFPNLPDAYLAGIPALLDAGRPEEAEALAVDAIKRFPEDVRMAERHAQVAAAREDWPEALRRWEAISRTYTEYTAPTP